MKICFLLSTLFFLTACQPVKELTTPQLASDQRPRAEIAGLVTGDPGGLILNINNSENITLATNQTQFQFQTEALVGSPLNITILQHPSNQFCRLVNPPSKVSKPMPAIKISCGPRDGIAGTISGLQSLDQLTLIVNGDRRAFGNGSYSFDGLSLQNNKSFTLQIIQSPYGKNCKFYNQQNSVTGVTPTTQFFDILCKDKPNIAIKVLATDGLEHNFASNGQMRLVMKQTAYNANSSVAFVDQLTYSSTSNGTYSFVNNGVTSDQTFDLEITQHPKGYFCYFLRSATEKIKLSGELAPSTVRQYDINCASAQTAQITIASAPWTGPAAFLMTVRNTASTIIATEQLMVTETSSVAIFKTPIKDASSVDFTITTPRPGLSCSAASAGPVSAAVSQALSCAYGTSSTVSILTNGINGGDVVTLDYTQGVTNSSTTQVSTPTLDLSQNFVITNLGLTSSLNLSCSYTINNETTVYAAAGPHYQVASTPSEGVLVKLTCVKKKKTVNLSFRNSDTIPISNTPLKIFYLNQTVFLSSTASIDLPADTALTLAVDTAHPELKCRFYQFNATGSDLDTETLSEGVFDFNDASAVALSVKCRPKISFTVTGLLDKVNLPEAIFDQTKTQCATVGAPSNWTTNGNNTYQTDGSIVSFLSTSYTALPCEQGDAYDFSLASSFTNYNCQYLGTPVTSGTLALLPLSFSIDCSRKYVPIQLQILGLSDPNYELQGDVWIGGVYDRTESLALGSSTLLTLNKTLYAATQIPLATVEIKNLVLTKSSVSSTELTCEFIGLGNTYSGTLPQLTDPLLTPPSINCAPTTVSFSVAVTTDDTLLINSPQTIEFNVSGQSNVWKNVNLKFQDASDLSTVNYFAVSGTFLSNQALSYKIIPSTLLSSNGFDLQNNYTCQAYYDQGTPLVAQSVTGFSVFGVAWSPSLITTKIRFHCSKTYAYSYIKSITVAGMPTGEFVYLALRSNNQELIDPVLIDGTAPYVTVTIPTSVNNLSPGLYLINKSRNDLNCDFRTTGGTGGISFSALTYSLNCTLRSKFTLTVSGLNPDEYVDVTTFIGPTSSSTRITGQNATNLFMGYIDTDQTYAINLTGSSDAKYCHLSSSSASYGLQPSTPADVVLTIECVDRARLACQKSTAAFPMISLIGSTTSYDPWIESDQALGTKNANEAQVKTFDVDCAQEKIYLGGDFNYVGPYTGLGSVLEYKSSKLSRSSPIAITENKAPTVAPLSTYKFTNSTINGFYPGQINSVISDNNGGWYIAGKFNLKLSTQYYGHLLHILPNGLVDLKSNLDTAFSTKISFQKPLLIKDGQTLVAPSLSSGTTSFVSDQITLYSVQASTKGITKTAVTYYLGAASPGKKFTSLMADSSDVNSFWVINIDDQTVEKYTVPTTQVLSYLLPEASTKISLNTGTFNLTNASSETFSQLTSDGTYFYVTGLDNAGTKSVIRKYNKTTLALVTEIKSSLLPYPIRSMILSGSTLLLGGGTPGGTNLNYLVSLSTAFTSAAAPFLSMPKAPVYSMALDSAYLYVGTSSFLNSQIEIYNAGLYTKDISHWLNSFASDAGQVTAIGIDSNSASQRFFIGSNARSMGGAYRPAGLAAVKITSGDLLSWNPSMQSTPTVNRIRVAPNRQVYVAGKTLSPVNSSLNYVLRFNNDSTNSLDTSFAPDWTSLSPMSQVLDLSFVTNSANHLQIYLSGDFKQSAPLNFSPIQHLDTQNNSFTGETLSTNTSTPLSAVDTQIPYLLLDSNSGYVDLYFINYSGTDTSVITSLNLDTSGVLTDDTSSGTAFTKKLTDFSLLKTSTTNYVLTSSLTNGLQVTTYTTAPLVFSAPSANVLTSYAAYKAAGFFDSTLPYVLSIGKFSATYLNHLSIYEMGNYTNDKIYADPIFCAQKALGFIDDSANLATNPFGEIMVNQNTAIISGNFGSEQNVDSTAQALTTIDPSVKGISFVNLKSGCY